MGVVINEFEVIAASSQSGASTPKKPDQADPKPVASTIHDIVPILRRQAERAERIRAH